MDLAVDVRLDGRRGGAVGRADHSGCCCCGSARRCSRRLRSRSVEYKAELTRRFAEHALPLFASGDYTPVLDAKSFALDDAQAAHEYLEENSSIGKVTLLVESTEVCEAEWLSAGLSLV